MKKLYWLPLALPLAISPIATIISCSQNPEDNINPDQDWENAFQKFYLRKLEFNYQELDLPADIRLAANQITLDWLWNQKADAIFYQDRIKRNFSAIWDYRVELFDYQDIRSLKIKLNFLKQLPDFRPQISPILEFKIGGFTK